MTVVTDQPAAEDLPAPPARRGRPRAVGDKLCARCRQSTPRIRARWPDGAICYACFSAAARTRGSCAGCHADRLVPGRDAHGDPLCVDCAGITTDLRCDRCGQEEEHYRKGICARCALRDDLTPLLGNGPTGTSLLEALCSATRPQSTLTWMRNPAVRKVLAHIGGLSEPLTHHDLDVLGQGRHVVHLRGVLEHHQLLPARDPDLARFEAWLQARLDSITEPAHRQVLQQFATWHHLRRLRAAAAANRRVHGSAATARQDITEAGRLLTWLHAEGRTLTDCPQHRLDHWLVTGPSTRYRARTFLVWAARNHLTHLTMPHQRARLTPTLGQQQRLDWLRRVLTEPLEATPYRLAAALLLLYAQPFTRIAALRVDDITDTPTGMTIRLGGDPAPVPEPFAALVRQHLTARPNLRHTGHNSPWLFASTTPGRHLTADTIMQRVRDLGIDLRGARNQALHDLVTQAPAPVVAAMLGYSNQVTAQHAAHAAAPTANYASLLAPGH